METENLKMDCGSWSAMTTKGSNSSSPLSCILSRGGEEFEEANLRAGEKAQDQKSRSSSRWIPARRPE